MAATKKTTSKEIKEKKKELEDKTYGLKNKKNSQKVQKYIQSLEKSLLPKPDLLKAKEASKKAEKKKRDEELALLFKIVEEDQKVPPGADPRSIFCLAFKKGLCSKGDSCKFSHNPEIEKKNIKIDFFLDPREAKGVISRAKVRNRSICPAFLSAVESKTYGWFWICPNGGEECPALHALPEDYVFKQDVPIKKTDELTLEEFIELERANIEGTAVTEETFRKWLGTHQYTESEHPKKKSKLTGKELFQANPELFQDDEDGEGLDIDYKQREEELQAVDEALFASIEDISFD